MVLSGSGESKSSGEKFCCLCMSLFLCWGEGVQSLVSSLSSLRWGGGYSLVVSVSCEGREGEMLGLVCGLVDEYDSTQDG